MSKFLFDSIQAAQEMAYMLKAGWDGCNGIVLNQIDLTAIETAASLWGANWCEMFDKCQLPLLEQEKLLKGYKQGRRCFYNLCLIGVDLSFQDLSGIHLDGANLTRADLTGSSLEQASLWGANLTSCQLKGANLSHAHLGQACLQGANLQSANLSSASLREANLFGANLRGAVVTKAFLFKSNLEAANLCEAVFTGAFLSKANLNRAFVSQSNLWWRRCKTGIKLSNRATNFKNATLTGAIMPDGKLCNPPAKFHNDLILTCMIIVSSILLFTGICLLVEQKLGQQPSSCEITRELEARLVREKQAASMTLPTP